MKVTTQELGNREVELTIEVDHKRVDRAMRTVARQYALENSIPGFRPGKAPLAVVSQRVGRERLLREALEQIGTQIYQEALEEAGLEPYELNPLEIASYDPLILTGTLSLAPRAELGDYHLIRIDAPEIAVSEEEIDDVLREYQEENAQLVPVNRPVEPGDQVILDLRIEIGGMIMYDRKNVSFALSPGEFAGVPDELFEQIAGMEPGERQRFALTYPEDFGDENLAGETGTFTIFLHEVKKRELPELDDELAQTVGEFDTLEALRARTRETLMSQAKVEAEKQLTDAVMTQVMDMATVEYPAVAVEKEIDQLIDELKERLAGRNLTLDNYLMIESLTMDQLREQQRPHAEERLQRSAVLSEVVRREGIEVSREEIDAEIETIAAMYGSSVDQARTALSTEESRRTLRSRVLAQKAIDRLTEIATGEAAREDVTADDSIAAADETAGDVVVTDSVVDNNS